MTIIGDRSIFAIESHITRAVDSSSQVALGFFVIHVAGIAYGVREDDATMLGCSVGAIEERIARRGQHVAHFDPGLSAAVVADAYLAAIYDEARQEETFFGMLSDDFQKALFASGISWAPDGDEAFDDGSHVLQLDVGGRVRLIAFKSDNLSESLSDVWLSGNMYYGVLKQWLREFEKDLNTMLSKA